MSSPRRFPPPWSVEEQEACFTVRDHDGQALAYVELAVPLWETSGLLAVAERRFPRLDPSRSKTLAPLIADSMSVPRITDIRRGQCSSI
jgi:hypothetical protein